MAVRLKEWMIPYTWGIGIEITNNHIINVLLREANNLIHVNENNELYVDLQLDDGIQPDDDFPVGVTTGRILEEDWRPMNGLILNWKTTSWDYARLIIGSDNNVYIDIGDGNWILLGEGSSILNCNTRTFWIETTSDFNEAQNAYDWYNDGKNALIIHSYLWEPQCYVIARVIETPWLISLEWEWPVASNIWTSYSTISIPTVEISVDPSTEQVTQIIFQSAKSNSFIDPTETYTTPFNPTAPYHPTTKQYVDAWLALKQDILTAGTRITIDQNNVISADISGVFIYMWNVATVNDLPSWASIWDTYLVEGNGHLYAWDWTQWNDLWNTTIDLTPYFNKTTDDSDDITQGSTNLFVTTQEKSYWTGKQDQLTAGQWITIDQNNVISATFSQYTGGTGISISWTTINNTLPFQPETQWTLGQILQRTSTGYRWQTLNIDEFNPENEWTVWQVLKKTSTGYAWANESWGGGWGHTYYEWDWIDITNYVISNTKPFEPTGTGTAGQVLTMTNDGYTWTSISGSANVHLFTISSTSDLTNAQSAVDWLNAGNLPILKYNWQFGSTPKQGDYFFYPVLDSTSTSTTLYFAAIPTDNQYFVNDANGYTQCEKPRITLTLSNGNVTAISVWDSIESKANFISPTQQYTNAFIPTVDSHPATKKYVDGKEWHGTQAQYDLLPSSKLTDWVVYNILPN